MTAQVICIANQKGGVGKTTTALSLAAYLALAGQRTLLVDLDSQGNSSSVLAPAEEAPGLLAGGRPLATGRDSLSIIPSATSGAMAVEGGASRLAVRRALEPLLADFDRVVIDCPPSLAGVASGAVVAADEVVVPIQAEYYALEGLGQILALFAELRDEGFERPHRMRVLLCMYDGSLRLCRDVAAEVRSHLKEQVMGPLIPRDIALASAPSHRQTIIEHHPLSAGSLAYCAVAKEILNVR